MKVTFLWIGKSKEKEFVNIIDNYANRLRHYTPYNIVTLKESKIKGKSPEEIRKKEGDLILSKLENSDFVVLLDERGKHLSSIQLSEWIQHKLNISLAQVVFVIAGAYGAHRDLKERADYTLSLSHLTLTHDMARIFIVEQVYRAYTILRGEKYHNE